MSYQVGLITIGALVLALGFYTKTRGLEGFQAASTSEVTVNERPPPPSLNAERGVATTATMPNGPDSETLKAKAVLDIYTNDATRMKQKIIEIKDIFQVVENAKRQVDDKLFRMLDPEQLYVLEFMMEEVKFFAASSPELNKFIEMLDIHIVDKTPVPELVKTVIYTAHQEAQMLIYIYSTLPSLVVGSNLVIDNTNAKAEDIRNDNVIAEMKISVQKMIEGFPKPTERLRQVTAHFSKLISDYGPANNTNADTINQLVTVFTEYKRIGGIVTTIQTKSLQNSKVRLDGTIAKAGVNQAGGGVNYNDPAIRVAIADVNTNKDAKAATLTNMINLLTGLKTKVDSAASANPNNLAVSGFKNSIDTAIKTYSEMKSNIAADVGELPNVNPPSMVGAGNRMTESFQSYQNPYNQPSPITQQAFEFRLGKRGIVQSILG
jgi:hypothetical protein